MEREPTVTASAFAFGPGEGIFLAGFRMKKHRKVSAYRPITLGEHLFSGRANHHPVDIGDSYAEQAIAYRTANFINLHEKPPLARQDNPCVERSEA
ncbi:hypothetical protein D3C76_1395250 [compost metagenome]